MKRHYLFHSLCSSLTLALLAAQPAKAEPPARVAGVSSPTVRDITVKALKAKTLSGKSPSKSDRKLQTSIHKERKANRSGGVESKYQIHSYKSNQLTAQVEQKPQQTAPTPSSNTNAPNPKLQQRPQQRPKAGQIDLPNRSVPVPNYLNPNPNPLRFPTKPEEVQILGAQPISFRQALELARRNNLQLQQAQLSVQRSQASLRAVQAAEYPRVNLGAGVNNQRRYIFSDEPNLGFGQDLDTNTNTVTGDLSVSYDLFTSGGRRARIRAAEEQLRNDRLDLERITEEVRLNVSTRYYDLQQADELVRIQQSAVRNAQASLRDAQALEQAGVGTRFDVLTSQVQVARATQDLANALSQQRVSRRQLAVLVNLAESVIITAADPVEIAGLWNLTQEQSIIQAYKNRAELEQQLAQRNINEQQRRIALASLGPQISLAARYNLSQSLDSNNNNNNNFQQTQDFTDAYSLGANVTLNLYDGGEARARAREAEANIAIAETNFANQRNQIRLDVEQAYSQLQSNFENIQTASVALEQAREALRLARLRFQAGVGTQTEVIDSETRLTQAEGDRVNAILSYNRALAQLQRAISSGQQS